ncbi:hypothetical protein BaRGS_00018638 [Batillaria attramentaria]|uniref:Uncharacterized protein n=1 Tax=Batillaria attramentaria TaxID=370345 RepID=A0ABD0KST1_9CAEN
MPFTPTTVVGFTGLKRHSYTLCHAGRNTTFAKVDMRNTQKSLKTKQFSPWLCPVQHGMYSFRFIYGRSYVGMHKTSFSLLLSTKNVAEAVRPWTSRTYAFYESVGPVNIKCQDSPFQVVFEVEKLDDRDCAACPDSTIEIYRIEVRHVNSTIMEGFLPVTCPSLPPSTSPPASSTTNPADEAAKDRNSSGCLSGGQRFQCTRAVCCPYECEITHIETRIKADGTVFCRASETAIESSPSSDATNGAFDGYEHTPDLGAERMTAHLAPGQAEMNVTTRGRPVQGSRPVYVNTVSGTMTHSNETMTTNPPSQQSVTRSTGHFEEENQDYLIPRLPSSLHTDIVSGQRPGNYEPLNMYRTDAAIYTQLTNTGQPPRNA